MAHIIPAQVIIDPDGDEPPRLVVSEGSEDLGDLITAGHNCCSPSLFSGLKVTSAVRALRTMASTGANENKKASICTELRCVGIKFRKNLCSSRRVIWPE